MLSSRVKCHKTIKYLLFSVILLCGGDWSGMQDNKNHLINLLIQLPWPINVKSSKNSLINPKSLYFIGVLISLESYYLLRADYRVNVCGLDDWARDYIVNPSLQNNPLVTTVDD